MNIAEALVERYVTRNGLAFVCPQYTLKPEFDGQKDFDLVVLDFKAKKVILIEVSDSGDLGSLGDLHEYESKYLDRLREQVADDSDGMTADWKVAFLGFVRKDCVEEARRRYKNYPRMAFRSIEETVGNFWDERGKGLFPTDHQSLT